MEYNVKSIRKSFAERGVFYTDSRLAEKLKNLITVDYSEVYDPTCGDGALLAVFPDNIGKYGQEIDPVQLEEAEKRLTNFHGVAGDTLASPGFADKKFRAIVANPPFSVKWRPDGADVRFSVAPALAPQSKADYAFILHVLHYLAPGGQAAVLNFPGVLYRGNSEGKIRRWLVEQNVISKVISVEGGYFVDTKIQTAIIVLDKGKITTDVIFAEMDGRERAVPLSEIEDNDFNLSVSCYLPPEVPERPPVNALDLEMKAREDCIRRIRYELDTSRLVCELEGWNIQPFIDAVRKAVRNFERECTISKSGQLNLQLNEKRYEIQDRIHS